MSIFLWLEYLLADSVAIFALGYLSQNEGQVSHEVILWAPFLLLHLGGQDTITALSIEDNELWKGHLLTFISQAGIAIYVFRKSGRPSSISWAGSFIFIAGILKYVERIWALQKASMSSLRSSCTMGMEKLGKYQKYMSGKYVKENDEDYGGVVSSRRYFCGLEVEKAYKVIEVELYFMYDILHTKAVVLHKDYKPVEFELKKLVFSELRRKIGGIEDEDRYDGYRDHRGEIKRKGGQEGWYEKLGWSLEREFDRSILMWHLATDILVHYNEDEEKKVNKDCSYRDISEDISKYMLFILIARPFMLPSGIGQIRFRDTCAHVEDVVLVKGRILQILKEASIAKLREYVDMSRENLHNQWREGEEIFGEHRRSILADGVKRAQQLQELFIIEVNRRNFESMWELISGVWVEMLCFAVSKCGGSSHTKQLSMGGEFLTHVSFLMAHMGIGEEHRFAESVKWGKMSPLWDWARAAKERRGATKEWGVGATNCATM
ncbi:hypothetical protein LUZ60_012258 [Juncus effusus]|nr:hypothetical protein LUZ60_012258 [Juncus effusus]